LLCPSQQRSSGAYLACGNHAATMRPPERPAIYLVKITKSVNVPILGFLFALGLSWNTRIKSSNRYWLSGTTSVEAETCPPGPILPSKRLGRGLATSL
jgi:hypothetical protein